MPPPWPLPTRSAWPHSVFYIYHSASCTNLLPPWLHRTSLGVIGLLPDNLDDEVVTALHAQAVAVLNIKSMVRYTRPLHRQLHQVACALPHHPPLSQLRRSTLPILLEELTKNPRPLRLPLPSSPPAVGLLCSRSQQCHLLLAEATTPTTIAPATTASAVAIIRADRCFRSATP
ncbi:hypothetical protein GUJ93_ZPchr0004g39135 [Zizania palustris]|uniref:Uncharacterized protein n=1 Tax=Zizania palustris TaxID=103762 RepID=A0A8J5T0Z9_ZIZPA|nr:hypothetical protein GUJ93_ZPchr0004g39135 [Zizania palustris]